MIWPNLRTGSPSAIGAIAILCPREIRWVEKRPGCHLGPGRHVFEQHRDVVGGVEDKGGKCVGAVSLSIAIGCGCRGHGNIRADDTFIGQGLPERCGNGFFEIGQRLLDILRTSHAKHHRSDGRMAE